MEESSKLFHFIDTVNEMIVLLFHSFGRFLHTFIERKSPFLQMYGADC